MCYWFRLSYIVVKSIHPATDSITTTLILSAIQGNSRSLATRVACSFLFLAYAHRYLILLISYLYGWYDTGLAVPSSVDDGCYWYSVAVSIVSLLCNTRPWLISACVALQCSVIKNRVCRHTSIYNYSLYNRRQF